MLVPGIRLLLEPRNRRRCIGVVLFLTVFALPLHFHTIATTLQLTKECSCLHGNRMQMGSAATPDEGFTVLASQAVVIPGLQEIGQRLLGRHSTRAPPSQIRL